MKTRLFAILLAMAAIFVYNVASAQKMTILDGFKPSVSGSELKIEGEVKLELTARPGKEPGFYPAKG